MLLVGISIFVSAKINNDAEIVEVNLVKGWNLVVVSPLVGSKQNDPTADSMIASDSEIKQENIKAIYYYSRHENKYLQVYPNADEFERYLRNARAEELATYIMQSSVWLYSNKAGVLKYTKTDLPLTLDNIILTKGWNFVTIIPEMDGKSLNDFKGKCEINKAYLWDAQNQQWGTITNLLDDKNILQREADAGYGFIVKVLNDCKLSQPAENVAQPPTIPN